MARLSVTVRYLVATFASNVNEVDDHGVHGEMRNDAMNVASVALETNQEEKDISRHIKVCVTSYFYIDVA